ncbi:restriction endonuclease [Actinokineospora spheciospongiae]|uniref:restriction endonuclease n=1 Tax=Actinokineospora spheciospongiae TaxID=909613 RepID=UPI000A060977|nr:restriction endonuclease [Actinokineospora spheciospongiae]
MPVFDPGVEHPVQLALWGRPDLRVEGDAPPGMSFDVAKISIADSTEYNRPRISNRLTINGKPQPSTRYPVFKKFRNNTVVDDLPGFENLPTRVKNCPYCHTSMGATEIHNHGPEDGDRTAGQLLEYCPNCTFWQAHGLRMQGYEARCSLFYNFDVAVLSSKVKEFETDFPEGSLSEISQWLRRHPEKYQTMPPRYLEVLVTKLFRNIGTYVEARHVGRPGDGGVDVLLVDAEGCSWLVQVKRREDVDSAEPVSTIRNVLGSMVLEGFKHSIIVSTADRFTLQAQQATGRAEGKGYEIQLVDRGVLDRIIGRSLPVAPWHRIQEEIRKGDAKWVAEEWCFCGCTWTRKVEPYNDI